MILLVNGLGCPIMAENERIEVETSPVGCDGGGGPMGHPMVYLTIDGGDDGGGETVCPYCSRRFVLAEGAGPPADH